jgi:hypothetical protein
MRNNCVNKKEIFNLGPLGELTDNYMGGSPNSFGQVVGGYPGPGGFGPTSRLGGDYGSYPNYGSSFGY